MTDRPLPMRLRFPKMLRKQIEEAASANKRSLNAEITARLEASFTSEASASKLLRVTPEGDPLEARVTELEVKVAKLEKRR